ncbi:MAG: iron-containing alcohol dehydrogenase [Candidatus Izemoplasmatales bacterium]|jgi:alcohol dehydrogenase YqhD (iron-dependent ADH family)
MENFSLYTPTEIVFGKDAELEVANLLKQYKATRVFIHYGGGSVIKSGLLGRIKGLLDQADISYFELGGVLPNPRSGLVYKGIELCRREGADFVLAVGGGSTIDSAKAIAAGVKYEGDFWDFYIGKATIQDALPIGVVLTIAATGSEASQGAVITQERGMFKRGLSSRYYRPRFSLVNPELAYTLPRYHLFAGIADIMSHIFERYLTLTKDVILTDRMSEAVLKSVMEAARIIKDDPTNYEAMATIFWSGTIAHNGLLGVGRQEDWSSHALEHELSALYDVSHGAGLAVIFPAFMEYTIDVDPLRYKRLAVKVFDVPDDGSDARTLGLRGIDNLKSFYRELGLPVTFAELGAKCDDIDKLVEKLRQNRGEVIGSFKRLTMEDAKKIYLLACK